jgi:hypothetical protein
VQVELARAVTAYATVRYVNGFYHGLEFTLVRDQARGYIDKLCDAHAKELQAVAN